MKTKQQYLVGTFLFIAMAIFIAVITLYPSFLPAAPSVSWVPSSISQTIIQGKTTTVHASFTASKNLNNVVVRVVPEIAPYIQVEPLSFGDVSKGETRDLALTISAPTDAKAGIFEGTVQLRGGNRNFAKPLPVTIIITSLANLVAHYPLDGSANDASENGHHGTVSQASLTTDRFGNPNSAYLFDGVDDVITIPHYNQLNSQEITISSWIYGNNPQLFARIVDKYLHTEKSGYMLINGKNPSGIRFDFGGTDGNWHGSITNSPLLNGQWQHVAATYDGNTARLYYNGELDNSVTIGATIQANSKELTIGNGFDGNSRIPFSGKIDEVRIYNGVLSDNEIAELHTNQDITVRIISAVNLTDPSSAILNPGDTVLLQWSATGVGVNSTNNMNISLKRRSASGLSEPDGKDWFRFTDTIPTVNDGSEQVTIPDGLNETDDWLFFISHNNSGVFDQSEEVFAFANTMDNNGLVAYYPFNGNANDESGNGNHGTVHGAVLTEDRFGTANSAFDFDGIDDDIQISDSDTLDIGQNDYTITAWIRTASTRNNGRIFSKGSSDCVTGYMMRMGGDKSSKLLLENAVDNSCKIGFSGNTTINDDAWHFVVGVVDRDIGAKIFIDGNLDGEMPLDTSVYDLSNSRNPTIGSNDVGNYNEPFDGVIDDLRIYTRVLSPEEINGLYSLQ